ncbi:hypothetical protein C8Q78DRAFT_52089 [Trametes maxima]|nr:hypothetical protein C8Q78DRAFT_52089 [Trametes maxima]
MDPVRTSDRTSPSKSGRRPRHFPLRMPYATPFLLTNPGSRWHWQGPCSAPSPSASTPADSRRPQTRSSPRPRHARHAAHSARPSRPLADPHSRVPPKLHGLPRSPASLVHSGHPSSPITCVLAAQLFPVLRQRCRGGRHGQSAESAHSRALATARCPLPAARCPWPACRSPRAAPARPQPSDRRRPRRPRGRHSAQRSSSASSHKRRFASRRPASPSATPQPSASRRHRQPSQSLSL